MTAKDVESGLRVAKVVIMDTMVGGTESKMVTARRVELYATNVCLRLQCGDRVRNVCRPTVGLTF